MTAPRLPAHRLDEPLIALRVRDLLLGLALVDLAVRRVHLLEDPRRLGRVLAAGADLVAVFPKHDRERDAGQREERWDGRRPVEAEVAVHLGREEREGCAEEGAQNRIRSKD